MRNNIYLNSLIVRDIAKISITFCNKTDPSEHLKRENHSRSILKTIAPWGVNVEESV